jgi:hypothetical protein
VRELTIFGLFLIVSIFGYLENATVAVKGTSGIGPLSGQIIADPANPQWLKYNNGGHFFMCGPGDPEDFLYRGRRNADGTRNGDQMSLINKMKGTGANSIYFQAVRSHGGDGPADHNPFVNSNPAQGLDVNILNQWEVWFDAMEANGIVIYFFFYDDGARIWNTGHSISPEERSFIQGIVNRFKHHKLMIWVVAEEYQEAYSPARVRNIAGAIRAADEHHHVIAVHKRHGLDFSEFTNDPNIGQFAIQYNEGTAPALHKGMVIAWKNASGKYNINMSEAANHGTGETARKKSWAIAMGGAYVMIVGMDIANTPINDLKDCGRLVEFMQSTDFTRMAPHDELSYEGADYVLALPGDSYIAYASNLSGKIGLRGLVSGLYDFLWYDPINGASVRQANVSIAAGNQAWQRPTHIGREVAVHIRRITPTAARPSMR